MQKKLVAYAFVGLLVVSVLAFAAPPASAQVPQEAPAQVEVRIQPYEQPIRPLSGFAVLRADVIYAYHNAGSPSLGSTTVSVRVTEQPPWATVTISPSTLLFDTSPGQEAGFISNTQRVNIYVATTADAPAFTPGTIRISANAQQNQAIGSATGDDSTLIQADYYSIIDAQVASPIRVVRPQTVVEVPITLTNLGNGNTRVNFEPLETDKTSLRLTLPNPPTVEATQAGGSSNQRTVNLNIQTPFRNGYLNQPDVMNMNLKGQYAHDTSMRGDEVPVSLLITTKGFYVPGAGALAVLGLLGLAAVALPRSASLRKER